jgi:hypothetical protein
MSHSSTARSGRLESAVEALILLAVAGMAGCASFTHVHDWTMHNSPAGTGDWFGWANAMVSELIPLAAGLEARRRRRLFGKAGAYPIALIVAAAALSLTGQLAEAIPSPSGWLISAVPALGFLALVKLVLSSPSSSASTDSRPEPTPAGVANPAVSPAVRSAEPIPAHLLAMARFAATQHEQTNGQSITANDLAARMSLTPAHANQILAALVDDTPKVNGHQPSLVATR